MSVPATAVIFITDQIAPFLSYAIFPEFFGYCAMFFSLSTSHVPATDLGYLLHKNPARVHTFDFSAGRAVMFYPAASAERCTFVMTLEIDAVSLVRNNKMTEGMFDQYVNDRPYAVSSFLSVALARSLREAMAGISKERQELADTAIPLEAVLTPLPVRGALDLVERLFAPLGYAVTATPHPFDPERPIWGESPYVTLHLSATCRLSEMLTHLYVLLPVLDNRKHYYISDDEVEKLLARGEDWLAAHPERDLIVTRYLKRRGTLVRTALSQLIAPPDAEAPLDLAHQNESEETLEKPLRLHDRRHDHIAALIEESNAQSVLDLGCGTGHLITRLLRIPSLNKITGIEVSSTELSRAIQRFDTLPERLRDKLTLLHGSLIYRDERLHGFDAAALVEVIEHMELDRLPHLERVVFEQAAPKLVIVTTPNREYNVLFPNLQTGRLRHTDHRFEWTRAEFHVWAERVAENHGYTVRFEPLGDEHPDHGAPSQMAVFEK